MTRGSCNEGSVVAVTVRSGVAAPQRPVSGANDCGEMEVDVYLERQELLARACLSPPEAPPIATASTARLSCVRL